MGTRKESFTENPSKLRSRIRVLEALNRDMSQRYDRHIKQSQAYISMLQQALGIGPTESVLAAVSELLSIVAELKVPTVQTEIADETPSTVE
jgi:hypothetical protein